MHVVLKVCGGGVNCDVGNCSTDILAVSGFQILQPRPKGGLSKTFVIILQEWELKVGKQNIFDKVPVAN